MTYYARTLWTPPELTSLNLQLQHVVDHHILVFFLSQLISSVNSYLGFKCIFSYLPFKTHVYETLSFSGDLRSKPLITWWWSCGVYSSMHITSCCTHTHTHTHTRARAHNIFNHFSDIKVYLQWRIQDFPEEGRQLPGGRGGGNKQFCQIFPKTAWNRKNLDPGRRGGVPCAPT